MTLRIEKAVYGGSGLAHETDGRVVLVPFVLPGEVIDLPSADGATEGGEFRILQGSPERVEPQCIHFGECGGCHYQHASYAAQVAMKRSILRETMERAGVSGLPEIEAHTAGEWGYRNRIRLRVEEAEGEIRVGYNRRGSVEFLPIQMCPISAPLLWRAAEALVTLARESNVAQKWMRDAAEVELFCTGDESRLQMTVFAARERPGGWTEFCEALKERIPELAGAGVMLLSPTGRRRQPKSADRSRWGADGLQYAASGRSYWVSRGGFFQVNRFLVDRLVELVTRGRSGRLAWDLYAGVGLFSRALTESFGDVVGVEAGEAAARDLASAAKGGGLRGEAMPTVEFLRRAVLERDRPELVVMDPPRAGVGAEVSSLLARINAPEMVYVSCDPSTLARDLRPMVDSGYNLAELHMVDLFPQTFHLETVAVLRRAERG